MHRTIPILAVAFLVAMIGQAPAAVAPEDLTEKQTAERLRKPLGEINLPKATLEKRIAALRAIAEPLGIRLSLSKGVEASAKRWTCAAVALKNGNLALALQYTSDNTKLIFSVRRGEVHLLLVGERPKKPKSSPDSVYEDDPFK